MLHTLYLGVALSPGSEPWLARCSRVPGIPVPAPAEAAPEPNACGVLAPTHSMLRSTE